MQAVEALYEELDPTVLLMPNSVNGLDYAPAVANRLDRPLVTDVVDIDAEDGLTATRELYGSKAETTIDVHADQAAVTIRPAEGRQPNRTATPQSRRSTRPSTRAPSGPR